MKDSTKDQFNLDFRPDSYWGGSEGRPHRGPTRVATPPFIDGFLPEYTGDEVEIARIELRSTTGDVISIHAKQGRKFISYRVVDEYSTEFRIHPRRSPKPLSMAELIELIDGAEWEENLKGLATAYIQVSLDCGSEPENYYNFITVVSGFYPELEAYYREQITEWLKKRSGGEVK